MKLSKIFSSKKYIVNQINKRARNREDLITIKNLTNKADEAFLKENISTLATFANKNNLSLEFTNGENLFKNQTIMKVFKEGFYWIDDMFGPVLRNLPLYLGENYPNMSNVGKNSRAVLKSIKTAALELLEKK